MLALAAGLLVDCLYAQGFTEPTGSFTRMVGSCSVTEKNNWSVVNNPACLTLSQKPEFGAFSEQRFGLSDLRSSAVSASFSYKSLHTGIAYQYYGITDFNEQTISLSLARKLNKSVRLGATLVYRNLFVAEYGNTGALVLATGLRIDLSAKTTIGLYLQNLSLSHYEHLPEQPLPVIARAGMRHQVAQSVILLGEWEQTYGRSQQLRLGLRYTPLPGFMLATGYHTAPDTYTFGTGIRYKKMVFQFAGTVHPYLGFTPSIDLMYSTP